MNGRKVGLLATAALVLAMLCGIPIAAVIAQQPEAFACGSGDASPVDVPTGGPGAVGSWNAAQTRNAAIIVAVGKGKKVPPRGWIVALATAIQESGLRNMANDNPAYPRVRQISMSLPHQGVGHDHDSVGMFQQRPIEGDGGWGTVRELMDPPTSAGKFFSALLKVKDWQSMGIGEAAQAVQVSAYPDAYDKHIPAAEKLVTAVADVTSIEDIPGASTVGCDNQDLPVSAEGWVKPVAGTIGSGFREPGRPDHQGVDITGAGIRDKPIKAAASGKVITVVCNASTGDCGHDGGMSVMGCGWYVEIEHPGRIVTRYCHMGRRPEVTVGQQVAVGTVIGFVGSSGNSSGPHLHFEVHYPVGEGQMVDRSNARNPIPFMRDHGAPL